jgi:hypothetical protein
MAEACLRQGAHYLDVTGEAVVFEALRARDAAARAAGVMLLPGAGFDVVPSDCLAAALAARLPDATRLDLAFLALGGVSRGTALTALEHLPVGRAWCARGGRLVPPPRGARTRDVDFGRGRGALRLPAVGRRRDRAREHGHPRRHVLGRGVRAPRASLCRAGPLLAPACCAAGRCAGRSSGASPRRPAGPRRGGSRARPRLLLGRGGQRARRARARAAAHARGLRLHR